MKLIIFAISLTVFAFTCTGTAQSVVITPKRVTYKRPKPLVDFKKSFTVTYPKIKASTPVLSRKIENTISFAKVLDLNIQEEIGEVQWLEEASYEVNYNANGILTITLSMNGTAAYPDGTSKTVAVDLKTGNRLRPDDVFADLPGLTASISRSLKAEIVKASKEIREDPENRDADPVLLFEGKEFTIDDLNEFEVNEKGVTFIYDYGFPHVLEALQPEGRFFYSWDRLKPFIKKGGLLTKFLSPKLIS